MFLIVRSAMGLDDDAVCFIHDDLLREWVGLTLLGVHSPIVSQDISGLDWI